MTDASTVQDGDRTDARSDTGDAPGDDGSSWRSVVRPNPDERLGTKATLVGLLFFGGGGVAFAFGAFILVILLSLAVIVGVFHIIVWTLTLGMFSPFEWFLSSLVLPVLQSEVVPLFGAGGILWIIGYGIVRARWWGWYAGMAVVGLAVAGLVYTTSTLTPDLIGPVVLAAVVAWTLWDERYAYGIGEPSE